MALFNDCESLHEIEMTPDRLREIANEMDRKNKSDLYQVGQVIRYKINHRFAFVYKPERINITPVEVKTETQVEEEWTVPSYGDIPQ